ncbi:unnamed protein product [Protopolystoma xenopodis]|uniref:Uncharacterized protein n=1 Tax=Protopolystoma xenopodis TaxID=117903 RepID=A0A448X9X6_9PLAT|nr:unnamed protein product [Protopolystoma xenopodis]
MRKRISTKPRQGHECMAPHRPGGRAVSRQTHGIILHTVRWQKGEPVVSGLLRVDEVYPQLSVVGWLACSLLAQ